MKYTLNLLFLLLLFQCKTYAQKEFYFKPFAGIGSSGLYIKSKNQSGGYVVPNSKSYYAGINLGLDTNHIRLETGLEFLTTNTNWRDDFWGSTRNDMFVHILFPISVGYSLNLSKKVSIIPQIALMPSIYLLTKSRIDNITEDSKTEISFETNPYIRRINLFSKGAISIEYKLSDKLAISVQPSFTGTLLSTANEDNNFEPRWEEPLPLPKIYHHSYNIVAGMRIRI